MKEIEELRKEIDIIDRNMAALFSKRMSLVNEIGTIKRNNNIKITDKNREQFIISNNLMFVSEKYQQYYKEFITNLIAIGKKVEKKENNNENSKIQK